MEQKQKPRITFGTVNNILYVLGMISLEVMVKIIACVCFYW